MSANICWEAIKEPKSIDVSLKSSFIEAMNKTFGESPWVLDEKDCDRLQAMSNATNEEAYEQIIHLIERFKEIRVFYQY